jgi:hypothetical protein
VHFYATKRIGGQVMNSEAIKLMKFGGTLVARGVGGGADVTFRNVPDGAVLPFRAEFVRATGTSATDIVALI